MEYGLAGALGGIVVSALLWQFVGKKYVSD
jgi:hypothetical protein